MFPVTQGEPLCHFQNWVKTHCLAINASRTGKGLFSNAVLWLWILVVSSTLLLCSWPEDAVKQGGEPIPVCTLKSWGWSSPFATDGCWCSASFVRMSIWKTVLEGLRALSGSCDGADLLIGNDDAQVFVSRADSNKWCLFQGKLALAFCKAYRPPVSWSKTEQDWCKYGFLQSKGILGLKTGCPESFRFALSNALEGQRRLRCPELAPRSKMSPEALIRSKGQNRSQRYFCASSF